MQCTFRDFLESVFNIIPCHFTAVQISHPLHRTLYHVTQGGNLLQIKKNTGCLWPKQNLLQYIVHTERLTMHTLLFYFISYEQLWKSLTYCKRIKFYCVWHILVHAFPGKSGLPAQTCRSIVSHWVQWMRMAPSKGFTRLDAFLYLKTEAELSSKTW